MASAVKHQILLSAGTAIAASALLFWFGNGLDPLWPLIWFAPLPVLLFATRHSWRSTLMVALLSSLLGSLNLWRYFRVLGMPVIAWLGIFAIVALVFAAAVLLFRTLLRAGAAWSALVAFPALWVSYEYLRNATTSAGTAGSFANSQLNFLPFLQLASITGPWGMSFLLMLFPAALAIGVHMHRSAPATARRIVTVALGLIALVLLFGLGRLAITPPAEKVKIGLIAADNETADGVAGEGAATDRLLRNYATEARALAKQGAQVIVLPEKIGVLVQPAAQTNAMLQSLADDTGVVIVAGVIYVSPPVKFNQARVYRPHKTLLGYNKRSLLPPFESRFKPGAELVTLNLPSHTEGVAICKDMDFTPLAREYGKKHTGLMLVPAWDFNLDRSWHGHIAIMRGVEDGFSIARSAKNGYLTVSDSRGRIVGESRSDSARFATLLAEVPVAHEATIYLLLGDWFAWLSMALLVNTLVQLYRLRRNGRALRAGEPSSIMP